jgi:two-component system, oxyanion-binding sensor
VTVSGGLAGALGDLADPLEDRARRLVAEARRRKAAGRALVLATVFRFSCHTILLRGLFAMGGGDLAEDADLVVLPPSLMVEGLGTGVIDGFCAGSPWNALAVGRAGGGMIALGGDILADFAEKVLAVPASLDEERAAALPRLIEALHEATAWLSDPANIDAAAAMLAAPKHLDCPPAIIANSLGGALALDGRTTRREPNYIAFGAGADDWIARLSAEMTKAGMLSAAETGALARDWQAD